MRLLISPSKIWAKKCALYTTKYGTSIELQEDLCPSPGGSAARPWLYPSAVTRRTQGTLRGCASQLQSHFSTVRGMHLETLPWAYLGINSRLDWGTLYDRDSVPHSTFSCGWLPNLLGSSVHFLVKSRFSKNSVRSVSPEPPHPTPGGPWRGTRCALEPYRRCTASGTGPRMLLGSVLQTHSTLYCRGTSTL